MSDDNVIQFRKRSPSKTGVEYYRVITRSWHPHTGEMMLPEQFKADSPEKLEAR